MLSPHAGIGAFDCAHLAYLNSGSSKEGSEPVNLEGPSQASTGGLGVPLSMFQRTQSLADIPSLMAPPSPRIPLEWRRTVNAEGITTLMINHMIHESSGTRDISLKAFHRMLHHIGKMLNESGDLPLESISFNHPDLPDETIQIKTQDLVTLIKDKDLKFIIRSFIANREPPSNLDVNLNGVLVYQKELSGIVVREMQTVFSFMETMLSEISLSFARGEKSLIMKGSTRCGDGFFKPEQIVIPHAEIQSLSYERLEALFFHHQFLGT